MRNREGLDFQSSRIHSNIPKNKSFTKFFLDYLCVCSIEQIFTQAIIIAHMIDTLSISVAVLLINQDSIVAIT